MRKNLVTRTKLNSECVPWMLITCRFFFFFFPVGRALTFCNHNVCARIHGFDHVCVRSSINEAAFFSVDITHTCRRHFRPSFCVGMPLIDNKLPLLKVNLRRVDNFLYIFSFLYFSIYDILCFSDGKKSFGCMI